MMIWYNYYYYYYYGATLINGIRSGGSATIYLLSCVSKFLKKTTLTELRNGGETAKYL